MIIRNQQRMKYHWGLCIRRNNYIKTFKSTLSVHLQYALQRLTGTLRQNHNELGCNIQNGDFDYSLVDGWEKMSQEDQTLCIKYLQGDGCHGFERVD